MAQQGMKPYVRLASTLVLVGMGLFGLEQFGMSKWLTPGKHIDPTLLSVLVLAPVVLVVLGVLVWIFGKMRRL